MNVNPKTIITLIGDSSIGFANANDNEIILSQISEKGYNREKMEELLAINAKADQKFHELEVKHGEGGRDRKIPFHCSQRGSEPDGC